MKEEENKSQNSKNTGFMSVLLTGLGKTLFLWFLCLSLLPLAVISFVSYKTAADSLSESASRSLGNAVHIKAAYINSYFEGVIDDLRQQSIDRHNIEFIQKLRSALEENGKTPGEFIKSFKAQMLYDEHGSDLKNFQKTFGYNDVFLIDSEGNILFTSQGEDDIGTNLFNGKYSETLFGIAARDTFASGQIKFSDYESYAPSQGDVTGFLVNLMLDDNGEKIGLFAIQLSLDKIDNIMHLMSGEYETEDAYLLGRDLKMRSNSPLIEEETVLTQVVDTEQSRSWINNIDDLHGHFILPNYNNYKGNSVVGAHDDIEIAGVLMGVFAEIEVSEALAYAIHLRNTTVLLFLLVAILIIIIAPNVTRRLVLPIRRLSYVSKLVAAGDLSQDINITLKNEIGELANNFTQMIGSLRQSKEDVDWSNWLKDGKSGLNDIMRGEQGESSLSTNILSFIAEYIKAQVGVLYVRTGEDTFSLKAGYAYKENSNVPSEFKAGEGIVGQAALEKQPILLTKVPDDYIKVTSGLGEQKPKNILMLPLINNNIVMGVLEIGSFNEFTDLEMEFFTEVSNPVAIAIASTQSRNRIQGQALEMQEQAVALQQQAVALQQQQEELKIFNEELQATNEELEEKTQSLEEQTEVIEGKNRELLNVQIELEKKAKVLEANSKYKSEFLANMSHELRTPLNSLLLLSQDLAANKEKNLSEDQIEAAGIIYGSGSDLLTLINEILDLAKIESGKMTVNVNTVQLIDIASGIYINFKHVMENKGLILDVKTEVESLESISTDSQKLEQILKNFMSNAIKFTEKGTITIDIHRPSSEVDLSYSGLDPQEVVAFSCTDSGIGIPEEVQAEIFQAFQQADGSTSRKYGGTGLGLSISRELAKLLGGEVQLRSKEGEGSTFTLYIPIGLQEPSDSTQEDSGAKHQMLGEAAVDAVLSSYKPSLNIDDDRDSIRRKDDRVILVIEDDMNFAKTLRKLCNERDFKCIHAGDGATGLDFATKYKPDAILLDIKLPNIGGWDVLKAIKHNPDIRHIPVHIMSANEEPSDVIKQGAIGYLTKPVDAAGIEQAFSRIEGKISKEVKQLLIVEDDEIVRKHLVTLVGAGDVQITAVGRGVEAIAELKSHSFGCIILDLTLPDMTGFEVLKKLNDLNILIPPVIIYSAKDLTREEENSLQEHVSSIIVKGEQSEGRLLDETSLFLHRVVEHLPDEKRKIIANLYDDDPIFRDKKVLVVDDDMRNLFVLSKLLSERNVIVFKSPDGQHALDTLEKEQDMDLVLMDIMMPGMDGYETMRHIRSQKQFSELPVIAVTAKAMTQDREQCIEAGANDYIVKPIDLTKLLSVMRVWLHKK